MARLDLSGKKFGRLKTIEPCGKTRNHNILWRCECECGNEVIVAAAHLRSGHTKSCGCLMRETSAINNAQYYL